MSEKNIWLSLHAFQGEVFGAKKDSKNPHFRNNYASLESVWSTIRDPLQRAGLVVIQMPGQLADGCIRIKTVVVHAESGEKVESAVDVPVSKNDAQGVGSAITYGCRYSLMAMLGIPPTDDDGEAARVASERRPALPADAAPELRNWYTRNAKAVSADYVAAVFAHWESIVAIRDGIMSGNLSSASEAWSELSSDEKRAIWLAPTNGGIFTTAERDVIKSTEFREAHQVEPA